MNERHFQMKIMCQSSAAELVIASNPQPAPAVVALAAATTPGIRL